MREVGPHAPLLRARIGAGRHAGLAAAMGARGGQLERPEGADAPMRAWRAGGGKGGTLAASSLLKQQLGSWGAQLANGGAGHIAEGVASNGQLNEQTWRRQRGWPADSRLGAAAARACCSTWRLGWPTPSTQLRHTTEAASVGMAGPRMQRRTQTTNHHTQRQQHQQQQRGPPPSCSTPAGCPSLPLWRPRSRAAASPHLPAPLLTCLPLPAPALASCPRRRLTLCG